MEIFFPERLIHFLGNVNESFILLKIMLYLCEVLSYVVCEWVIW